MSSGELLQHAAGEERPARAARSRMFSLFITGCIGAFFFAVVAVLGARYILLRFAYGGMRQTLSADRLPLPRFAAAPGEIEALRRKLQPLTGPTPGSAAALERARSVVLDVREVNILLSTDPFFRKRFYVTAMKEWRRGAPGYRQSNRCHRAG